MSREGDAPQRDERDVATPPRGTPVPVPPAAAPSSPAPETAPPPAPETASPPGPAPLSSERADAEPDDEEPAEAEPADAAAPPSDAPPSAAPPSDAPPSDTPPDAAGQQVAAPTPTFGQPTSRETVGGPDPARRRRAFYVVALVVGLLATAWFSTEYLRGSWLQLQPHEAVTADADGFAAHQGLQVRLVEATDLGPDPGLSGSDWAPPAGFHAWRVVLETASTNADLSSCDVVLVDDEGRKFKATEFVENFAEGYEFTYTCSPLPPDTDLGPEQAMLALVPADAEIRTVEISSRPLWPVFLQLPIG